MKFTKYLSLSLLFMPLLLLSQTKKTIEIKNDSDLERKEAVVAIKWESILAAFPQIDTSNFVVINSSTKKQLPYQLEHRGQAAIQNLLVQLNIKAKGTVLLSIQKGKPVAVEAKTFARYVPERMDDFAWENDRIAFRAYGKALEKTKDDAYGLDVWVKRTDKMVINERYKKGDYHVDHGDGLDYYKVGYTLGAGNMAPIVKDSVYYSGNYQRWKLLDNGPLRSTFKLEYDSWDAAGIKVSCSKIISIDAGSQLNRIENLYTYEPSKALPLAVGISKRPESGVLLLDEQQAVLGYWEPEHGKDGITGVGSVLCTKVKKMKVSNNQILAVTEAVNNEPIVYYAGAAWNKAGKFTSASLWFEYLNKFSQELKAPLQVNVK